MRSSSRGCNRRVDEVEGEGARVEKLRYVEKNYKWLKLCDRLVIEHQQSERPTRTVGVW